MAGTRRYATEGLLFTPEGRLADRYVKRRLIPGLDHGYVTGDRAFVEGTTGIAICKDLDFPAMIREYGLPEGSAQTDFDLIEMDEGRWYPDMWRDAWK